MEILEIPATVLLLSGSVSGTLGLVKVALEVGTDVNVVDEGGRTALLLAAEKGHFYVVTWLL